MLQIVSAVLAVAAAAPAPQLLAAPWAHGGFVAAPWAHAGLVRVADDGQYRTGYLDSAIDLRGEYSPEAKPYIADDEGSYKADNEGAYTPDEEGAYKPDAEGQYDAATAHATEAVSEDGSYRGEPIALAYASPIAHHAQFAHAAVAHPSFGYAYNGLAPGYFNINK